MQTLRVTDDRAEYARLRALVELRLVELRTVLDELEMEQRWERARDLERVERGLAELLITVR